MSEEEYIHLSEIAKRRAQSVQMRIEDPDRFAGGWASGLTDFMSWLTGQDEMCPGWSTPFTRADYLERIWHNDSRLSGTIYTLVSRIASLGWQVSGPVEGLERWYELFSTAEGDWTLFMQLVFQDYLATDEGTVFETVRKSYPDGEIEQLWAMDARRTIPGPLNVAAINREGEKEDKKVWPLVFIDQEGWKGMEEGEFYRFSSLPSTDQYRRRLGFCFMSRILRYAHLANDLLCYQEERARNLPPEGIATITGLTAPQMKNAINEYDMDRRQRQSGIFPGILWLVSNVYGQEAKVAFTSFRDVWKNFSNQEAHEIFMKVVALDAGIDVGALWQVEFHGATKAASWLQHKKAQGKGVAEFLIAFERWASRIMPMAYQFKWETPDDEQDLQHEKIVKAKIDNARLLWEPSPTGEQLLTTEQVQDMLVEQRVIPARYIQPSVSILTDIRRSISDGKDTGTLYFPDGYLVRDRKWWNGATLKAQDCCDDARILDPELQVALLPIMKRWEILGKGFRDILSAWYDDIIKWIQETPEVLENDGYWIAWGDRIESAMLDEFIQSAMEGSLSTGIDISFDTRNEIALQVAQEQMFDLVKLDGDESMVRSTRDFLERTKARVASGEIPFSDLANVLAPQFGASRAEKIAVTENSTLWGRAQLETAQEAGLTQKRSIRADAARVCPSQVCPNNAAQGWIPINATFQSGDMHPSYHPFCYCFVNVR